MEVYTLFCLISSALVSVLVIVQAKTVDVREDAYVSGEHSGDAVQFNEVLKKLEDFEKRITFLEGERVSEQRLKTEEDGLDVHRQHVNAMISGREIHKRAASNESLPSIVAFSAAVMQTKLTNLSPGSTLVYAVALTNHGGGYNNLTGVFTAPVSGVYVFHIATMVEPFTVETVEVVRDGHNIASSYIPAGTMTSAASELVIADLDQGQQVWVRTFQSSSHGNGVVHGNGYTTFSGWIIAYK